MEPTQECNYTGAVGWAHARERARERAPANARPHIYLALVVACKFTVVGGRGFTGPYNMVAFLKELRVPWHLLVF